MNVCKKFFLLAIFSIVPQLYFAQIPLLGVWENASRKIIINSDEIIFILKQYYGLHEETVALAKTTIIANSNRTTLLINFSAEKKPYKIPIAIVNDALFIDFYYKTENPEDSNKNPVLGFWKQGGNTYGLTTNAIRYKKEVDCLYFTENTVYTIRYWQVEVPYENEQAELIDGDLKVTVDKLLEIGDVVYTCVTGRGTLIRNLKKSAYKIENNAISFASKKSTLPFSWFEHEKILSLSKPHLERKHNSEK